MKKTISLTVCMLAVLSAGAQNVTGNVTDENHAPLDFVNVVVLDTDSAYVAGTITDENGAFLFEEPGSRAKFIKLSSVGYTTVVSPIPPQGNFGTIALQPESVMLGEVVVKSNRPSTSIKDNALVTKVAGSQLEHAGTANDVLAQVPMVEGAKEISRCSARGHPKST